MNLPDEPPSGTQNRHGRPASGLRIVVVDDDPPTLDVLELSLTLDGHAVVRACNGVEGLEQVRETRPDLVIVDWMMPVMDGITMTEQLRGRQRLSHLPIVMLTAKNMPSNVWAGLRSGVDAFVSKPLDLVVLRDELDRLCYSPFSTDDPAHGRPGPTVSPWARSKWLAAVSAAIAAQRLTLLRVAVAAKVAPSQLSRIVAGTTWPRLDTLLAMSAFLDIDLPELGVSNTNAQAHSSPSQPDQRSSQRTGPTRETTIANATSGAPLEEPSTGTPNVNTQRRIARRRRSREA
jgi:CheY-like chemotaxis protein